MCSHAVETSPWFLPTKPDIRPYNGGDGDDGDDGCDGGYGDVDVGGDGDDGGYGDVGGDGDDGGDGDNLAFQCFMSFQNLEPYSSVRSVE